VALGLEGIGALDPSGFQISVIVTNPTDGVRVPLWMKGKEANQIPGLGGLLDDALSAVDDSLGLGGGGGTGSIDLLGLDLPIVESVSLELNLGMVAKTTITIAAPFDLGMKLLESSLFRVGNIYEVQIGYPKLGRFTPWFTSIAQKPSIRITGDEGLTGTLNGDGGGMASLRGESSKVYEGKSYKEIIEDVADAHEWEVVFKEPGGGLLESAAAAVTGALAALDQDHPLDKPRTKVSQGNRSDWFFIQWMARASSCDAFLAPSLEEEGKSVLYVKKRKEALKKPPLYKFLMRGNSDFLATFPMFEFEIEPVGVYLPAGGVKTVSRDIDPLLKIPLEVEATSETSAEAALGEGKLPDSAEKKVEGVKVQLAATEGDERTGQFMAISARDPREPIDVCEANRNALAFRGGVNASISSYAIPELFPGSVVELAGVGIFNSNYWIESMTHEANATEWMMSLKLINNGSASGGLDEALAKDAEETNTEEVEEGVGAASGGASLVESVVEGAT
jgi:hypothetical protein